MSHRALPFVLVGVSLAWPSDGGLRAGETRGKTAGAEVRLRLEDQANRLWEDIPGGPAAGEGKNVTRLGGTPSACAGEALRRTKAALERAALGRVAVRSLEMKVGLEPALLKQHRVASAAHLSEIFDQYLESSSEQDFARRLSAKDPAKAAVLYRTFSSSRSDQVLLVSPDVECGLVRLLFEIRSLPDEPGRLVATFVAEGQCGCRAPVTAPPGQKLGRWRVVGLARMKPGDRAFEGRQAEVKWKLDEPRYAVFGICGPCPRDDSREPVADPHVGSGSCTHCDPLDVLAKAWESEATRAEEEARAKPAGGAAAKSLAERAAAARQAAAEIGSAAGRCREDCPVAPLPTADRSKGSGGTKKVLIGAGVVAVAAGGAAALSGSSSDAPAPRSVTPSPEPTPTSTPTPRPEPEPTPTSTPTPRPEPTLPPPPPPTCPDTVFGSYTVRAVVGRANPCQLASSFSGNVRISGTCNAMVLVISEPQGSHNYRGQVAADGSFSAVGGGTLQVRFTFDGALTGRVQGASLSANETLNFTSGCPGQSMGYTYAGSQ